MHLKKQSTKTVSSKTKFPQSTPSRNNQMTKQQRSQYEYSHSPKKRKTKPNIKIEYLQTQKQWLRNFKDFLEDVNCLSKQILMVANSSKKQDNQKNRAVKEKEIIKHNASEQQKMSKAKIKNSFKLDSSSLNNFQNKEGNNNNQQKKFYFQQKDYQNKKDQINKSTNSHKINTLKGQEHGIYNNQSSNEFNQNLTRIQKSIQIRQRSLLSQIATIKQDRYIKQNQGEQKNLYNKLQYLYETHLNNLQIMLQRSESNVQNAQLYKKSNMEINNGAVSYIGNKNQLISKANSILLKPIIINYSKYSTMAKIKQRDLMELYMKTKNKVISELRLINQLNKSIITNMNSNNQNLQGQSFGINTNNAKPIIHSQKVYDRYQISKQNQQLLQPVLIKFITNKFNKAILNEQLKKVKVKITELKNKNLAMEQSVKQLEYYKLMFALENDRYFHLKQENEEETKQENYENKHENKDKNKYKNVKKYRKNSVREKQVSQVDAKKQMEKDLLLIILEHQFLSKRLSLYQSTLFCGLYKKEVNSYDAECVRLQFEKNYKPFKNIRKFKSLSLDNRKISYFKTQLHNTLQANNKQAKINTYKQQKPLKSQQKGSSSTQTNI